MANSLEHDVEQLKQQVATLISEKQQLARAKRRWVLGGAAVALAMTLGTVASAASGACPNGYPFCFAADTTASASEVNHNFAQIKEWLEAKAGPVTAAPLTTTRVSADGGTFGVVATTALSVTSGLPVVVEAEVFRTISNGATEIVEPIGAFNGRRVCFLTGMEIHDAFADQSEARCQVETDGGVWTLRYDVDNGSTSGNTGPDLECAARCITW